MDEASSDVATSRPRRAAVLAGGASQRMPGGKPAAQLWGRPLLLLALQTARAAGFTPVVCARAATELPAVEAEVWREPASDAPPHPLAAIAWALQRADEPLLFLPVDLPLLPPAALTAVAGHAGAARRAAVLGRGGRPAALVAAVPPSAAAQLAAAASDDAPLLRTLLELGASLVEPDGVSQIELTNVNTPAALAALQAQPAPAWLAGPAA